MAIRRLPARPRSSGTPNDGSTFRGYARILALGAHPDDTELSCGGALILEGLQEAVEPDLVFIPFLEDPHQDHAALAHAAIRTFRGNETILQYEILRYGSHSFTPSLFVEITE